MMVEIVKAISAVSTLLAIAFLLTSGAFYLSVLEQTKMRLPDYLRDDFTMRFVIGTAQWERTLSPELRLKYVLAIGFSAVGFGCLAIAAYGRGYAIAAISFSVLFAITAVYGLIKWKRYRSLQKPAR